MDYEDLYSVEDYPRYDINFSSVSWFGELLSDLNDDHLRAIRTIIVNDFDERTYKDTPFWIKLNSLIANDAGDDFA